MFDFISAIINALQAAAPVASTAAELGSLGLQAYGMANQPKAPDVQSQPESPQGVAAPQPSPAQVKSLVSNRQQQGVYTGGAASPESLSGILGEGYDPSFIQQLLMSMGQGGQGSGFGGMSPYGRF